ncbi:MAG: glycerol-3-phosphate acyltransferase [Burkholderiales bacterium]
MLIVRIWCADETLVLITALFCVLGHMFPIWLKGKGGKGVATTLAVLLMVAPWLGVIACFTWVILFFITRISSLSSLIAMLVVGVISFFYVTDDIFYIAFTLAALVTFKHHQNIKRLMLGQEPRFTSKHS